jgi:hypothetical protein
MQLVPHIASAAVFHLSKNPLPQITARIDHAPTENLLARYKEHTTHTRRSTADLHEDM